eukprot:SM000202S05899  [mRNA]  locus=s202:101147:103919:- [translate_table: standard]
MSAGHAVSNISSVASSRGRVHSGGPGSRLASTPLCAQVACHLRATSSGATRGGRPSRDAPAGLPLTRLELAIRVGSSSETQTLPPLCHAPSRSSRVMAAASQDRDGSIKELELEQAPTSAPSQATSVRDARIDNQAEVSYAQRRSAVERLFSNVNEATLQHEPGSLTSSVLLVAGTTVGAGILAIPAVTQEAGFLPSAAACIGCWLFMVITGLLIAEVNVNTMCELGSGGVSLVSMAERTLGKVGVRISLATYLFIHYALLVLAAGDVNPAALVQGNISAVPGSIPIIALSFVYQNVVPVVTTNLEGNLPRVRWAIVLGTAIPLVMFLAWDAVILGSIPVNMTTTGMSLIENDPLTRLRESSGAVGPVIEAFSLLAVATSYIGFVLGLTDFLSDLLKLPTSRESQGLPYLLTLLPPLVLALASPDIFYKALDFAGTYGVLVLFGILPAAMAWSERYSGTCLPPTMPQIVPGGKFTLAIVMGAASTVIISELAKNVLTL